MQQNARQLPSQVTDSGGVHDLAYNYDANANVTHLWDLARGDHYSRWLNYDELDRLTTAGSGSFGGDGWHRFRYDALDNLKSWTHAGVKDYADYIYDAQNRLSGIRDSSGATVVGVGYDVQGNVLNHNGRHRYYDYGNRLRGTVDGEYYRYDGLGRRVQTSRPDGRTTLWQYSHGGQQLFSSTWEGAAYVNQTTQENVYLAGRLVATIEHRWPSNLIIATKYQHTDALGSPVAVTNDAGQVIERNDYEPYGAVIGKPGYSGFGYTGHIMDGATGLTYMQQRYYDQSIGRFLSVDPVTADSGTGANFNRYWYANNSPYRFVDPDGRNPYIVGGIVIGFGIEYVTRDENGDGAITRAGSEMWQAAGWLFRGRPTTAQRNLPAREVLQPRTGPTEPYSRRKHYGSTPTRADRKAVGAGSGQVADHDPPLVKRYYEGDPARDEKPGYQMSDDERRESARDRTRMKVQPKEESNRQGARMQRYSQEKKREHEL
jgi:RHS repeat-associated protein